jgi:general secretion pathway protein E/type IV pilus assembly protein PilB
MQHLLDKLNTLGLLDADAAGRAMVLWQKGEPIERAVLSVDGLTPQQLLPVVAQEYGVEYVDLDTVTPDRKLLSEMPARVLTAHKLLPLSRDGHVVRVAVGSLFRPEGLDELRLATGMDMVPVLADEQAIDRSLRKFLGVGAETVQSLVADASPVEAIEDESGDIDGADAAQDASIIKFVNQILADAIERRATDVHIEPFEGRLSVRFRIDGVLVDAAVPADVRRFQAAIISRLKILSHLDIAEKRLPQDGRIKLRVSGREVDVRVSVIPMLYGEAVVLRLLDRSTALTGLDGLGMNPADRSIFNKVLGLPHGIMLVTGPTGSGKTTTLYAGLSQINDIERKIITIEDPIEYHLDGVNQIQVDTKTGLTFSRGLRAILRHDPDVVLIGEIRDRETAEIAVQASLTGHLVFSTLHTNDAPGAVTRLIDMGIEPFLVSSSLEMVLAQRLVRLICSSCRTPIPIADAERIRRDLDSDLPDVLYHGKGCSACGGTGYRGRQGIFEMMPMTDELRTHVTNRVSSQIVRQTAIDQGMRSLREDGWRLIRDGRTTVEEVLRVTKDERSGVIRREAE